MQENNQGVVEQNSGSARERQINQRIQEIIQQSKKICDEISQLNKTSISVELPKIAIIGMEGTGKTVLMCVLAKKLSVITPEGYYLDPQNNRTMKWSELLGHKKAINKPL